MSARAIETVRVTIKDDAYVATQKAIETVSRVLLDPKGGLGKPTLDLFIERAERSMALGPILHPSEFRAAAGQLQEVIACARALRDARDRITAAAELAEPQHGAPLAGAHSPKPNP